MQITVGLIVNEPREAHRLEEQQLSICRGYRKRWRTAPGKVLRTNKGDAEVYGDRGSFLRKILKI